MVGVLRPSPKDPITVSHLMFDGEGRVFAKQLCDVLEDAGWPPSKPRQMFMLMNEPTVNMPVGVTVVIRDSKAIPRHFQAVFNALFAVGLKPATASDPNLAEGSVEILVGVKP